MDKCPRNACLQLTSRQFRITLHSSRDRSAVAVCVENTKCALAKCQTCSIRSLKTCTDFVAAVSSGHNGHNGRAITICHYDGFALTHSHIYIYICSRQEVSAEELLKTRIQRQ